MAGSRKFAVKFIDYFHDLGVLGRECFMLNEKFGVELGYQQFGEANIELKQIFNGYLLGYAVTADKGSDLKAEASGWPLGGSVEMPN